MKLTNKMDLPDAIVRAIQNDSYTKGHAQISVTGLLQPPQMSHLQRLHDDELTEDVSDRIWALIGQCVHTILERAGSSNPDTMTETTIYSTYGGWTIKGSFDNTVISDGTLNDYKVTSVRKAMQPNTPSEWIAQTNIYRRILQKERGITINRINVIALLRDWSLPESQRREDYPQVQVTKHDIPLWSAEETDAFIEERVAMHQAAEPAPCTDEDIWAKPPKWAIMKAGRKTAVRVLDSPEAADVFLKNLGGSGSYIEMRPGEAIRCKTYCNVARFCPQWKSDPRNTEITSENIEAVLSQMSSEGTIDGEV